MSLGVRKRIELIYLGTIGVDWSGLDVLVELDGDLLELVDPLLFQLQALLELLFAL